MLDDTGLSDAKRRLLQQRLRGARSPKRQDDRIPLRSSDEAIPLTPEQYGLWLASTLHPDLPAYSETVTVRYRGDLDQVALESAFNAFVARHEIWRTCFLLHQGEIVQRIESSLLTNLPRIDLSPLPVVEREAESNRLARQQALQPFDLEQAPLFRALLVRVAPGDWRLHLALHHLIFDGFSIRRTFLTELARLYEGFAVGSDAKLALPPLQYGDYAVWRLRQADSPGLADHLAFWRTKLAGELPVLRLPSHRPRPAEMSHSGNVHRFNISRELTIEMQELAQAQGATLYMALLASYSALLSRYSQQQDIIVGTVADGRRRPELESVMGYMLDLFAVRTKADPALTFSAYLRQVRHAVLEALAASDVPFGRVVETVAAHDKHGRRELSHQSIFQTVFAFQPKETEELPDWELGTTEVSTGVTKFDLYLEADEKPTHTAVRVYYSTDLFDAATIERMAGHWLTLMREAVRLPATPLGELPLLTHAERELMLDRWNDTFAPVPEHTMYSLVEAQVQRTPDAPAVTFEDRTLTYAQLEREANRFAHHLRFAGAVPETLVAVYLDRSEYMVAGLLGVLKTGAAYMPLDPGSPSARIALCLEDAQPSVILTQYSRLADLPPHRSRVLVIEDVLASPYPSGVFVSHARPESVAYLIHTSGSTGRPKGVELRHNGVVNFLLSMRREPGFTAADTLVAITTISFDIAVLELFLPLITGGRVVIASREIAVDPSRLADLLRSSAATVLQATPATWSALLSIDWAVQPGLKALCGGEALNRSLADRLMALGLDLWNLYGPTETTIWSTIHPVAPGLGPIPIGRPIANTTTYILDANLQPVPIGVPGELCIGGIGVARGYRNKPELTAEKFIARPAALRTDEAQPETLYRTGDYALYRADGIIECQGRADNQVKIRGHRIELEDVEVNLAAHPRVASAAARAWPDAEGGYRLCAYLTGVNGPPPNAAEMRQFLRSRVADPMIPSDIVALDAMPLTSSGKVDRKQLPEPDRTALTTLTSTPLEGDELRLANIWAELLHVDSIRATDNFFDLGGHSLMLLKLVRMVNREFGVELPITKFFQAPTVAKLAIAVREAVRRLERPAEQPPAWSSLIPLNPRGKRRPFFLIHSLMLYGRLPAALGGDQPFYALHPLPFESHGGRDYVERMLEDHIQQIKHVQPHGPYQLSGWCFAGWMAYEVARRLESDGEEVSALLLLDSWCPYKAAGLPQQLPLTGLGEPGPVRRGISSRLRSLGFKVSSRAQQFAALSGAARRSQVRRMMRNLWSSASLPVERRAKAALYRLFLRFDLPQPQMLRDPNVAVYDWVLQYQVRPYSGEITLIRPAEIAVPPDADPTCGWRPLTSGQIRSIFVPGDRSTMFLEPNLATLAETLRTLTS
jgi:amino acid adenylation domain-containing protein